MKKLAFHIFMAISTRKKRMQVNIMKIVKVVL